MKPIRTSTNEANGHPAPLDRSDAVNLASNIISRFDTGSYDTVTDKGIKCLADAVLRMDAALRSDHICDICKGLFRAAPSSSAPCVVDALGDIRNHTYFGGEGENDPGVLRGRLLVIQDKLNGLIVELSAAPAAQPNAEIAEWLRDQGQKWYGLKCYEQAEKAFPAADALSNERKQQ